MVYDDVAYLHPTEPVTLDPAAFQSFVMSAGPANAMTRADDLFEDFIVCLSGVETAWSSGEFDRLSRQAAMMIRLSEQLGLAQVASVARELQSLVDARDDVALAAVVARAVRLGEASLASVMEFAYRRI